jgi:hypothetical protein
MTAAPVVERAACTVCGAGFLRDQPWKSKCSPCWRASKGRPTELDRLRARIVGLEVENAALQLRLEVRPAPTIPAEMLRRLVQLCHPDRHGGSAAATAATAWLLDQRAR